MSGKYDVIECDVMLLGWSETHNAGEKVTFQLQPGQIDFFKAKTIKKGKTAGQLFKMVLVEVDGNGEPLPAEPGRIMTEAESKAAIERVKRGSVFPGGLCGLAVRWCNEQPEFNVWLQKHFPAATGEMNARRVAGFDFAAEMVKHICGVASRKELDTNADAAETFKTKVLTPYAAHRKELGLDE